MYKVTNIKKPKSLMTPTSDVTETDKGANYSQFDVELCWCVQQMESALNFGKLPQKVAQDTFKNLKVLKGHKAPLIKKRQIMKAAMGDYRQKMQEEEKKMSLASKQIKFTHTPKMKKFSFVKKSSILRSGKDFKFNFDTDIAKECQLEEQAKVKAVHLNTEDIQLTSDSGFRFNFLINEDSHETRCNEL